MPAAAARRALPATTAGCDPEMLRERMPEALELAFIREWVRQAGGDEFVLLAQALKAQIEIAPGQAGIRAVAPLTRIHRRGARERLRLGAPL